VLKKKVAKSGGLSAAELLAGAETEGGTEEFIEVEVSADDLDGDPQGSIMRTVVPEETTVDVGLDVEGDGEALADTQQTSMAFNNIELA